jgi:hypothetical protein
MKSKFEGRIFGAKTDGVVGEWKVLKETEFKFFPKFCVSDLNRE